MIHLQARVLGSGEQRNSPRYWHFRHDTARGSKAQTVSLETQTKIEALLMLWRDLPLRRDCLLLLLFLLHLRRMGAAVRYIMPQHRSQLSRGRW